VGRSPGAPPHRRGATLQYVRIGVLAALVAVLLAAAASRPVEGATAVSVPLLRVLHTSPFEVAGRSFKPFERVKVVVTTSAVYTKRVRAGRSGRFVVNFGRIALDRCTGFVVTASGIRGSRSVLESKNESECPSPAP